MTHPIWPLWARHEPLRPGLAYGPLNDDEVFQVEDGDGHDIVGRKSGAEVFEMDGVWPLGRDIYPAWKAWWKTETDMGRRWFWLTDPVTLTARLWRRKPGQAMRPAVIYPAHVHVALTLRSQPDA